MEKIPNINSNIEKIRTLEECTNELIGFQLEYIERVDKGLIKIPTINNSKEKFPNNFLKILTDHTSIEGYLEDEYLKRLPNPDDRKKDDFNYKKGYFVGGVMSQIYELYLEDKDNWKSRTMELLDSKVMELGLVVNDLDELSNKKENKCGLISFDFNKIGDPKNIEKLNDLGLNSFDDYVNIHFKSLFEQKMKDPSANVNQMHESFSLLAERIIDEYPQTKAIIGRSWIMDSKVGERLKFKIFDRHEGSVFSSSGFWGQFIDENGYMKKDEMNKFLSTGEAKFYPAEGVMIVEDFLKEYLPESRKMNGYVKLMEYTDEAKKFSKEIDEILFKINKDFKILSYDEVVKMVKSNKIVSDYLDTENGQEFLKMFKQLKDSGLKSMDDLIYEDKDRIKNNFNSFLNKHKSESVEKEVFVGSN